jgi:hypothetical protein
VDNLGDDSSGHISSVFYGKNVDMKHNIIENLHKCTSCFCRRIQLHPLMTKSKATLLSVLYSGSDKDMLGKCIILISRSVFGRKI